MNVPSFFKIKVYLQYFLLMESSRRSDGQVVVVNVPRIFFDKRQVEGTKQQDIFFKKQKEDALDAQITKTITTSKKKNVEALDVSVIVIKRDIDQWQS